MTTPTYLTPTWLRSAILAAGLLTALAGKAGMPDPEPVPRPAAAHTMLGVARPVQRLQPSAPGPTVSLKSEHFDLVYNPERLSSEQAEQARTLAERGWEHCEKVFGKTVDRRIKMDLTPDFVGATGFAQPLDARSTAPNALPAIGVRFGELNYLGLTGDYVVTHEIAHIFSGPVAGTCLGEGVADWGAGVFLDIPQRPWWGKALRKAGLWIDPDAFFITGDFLSNPEVNAVIRTSQYAEAGLLIQFLADRFGWDRVRAFAPEYSRARGRLDSNEDRAGQRAPGRLPPGAPDPRQPPDAAQVRTVFEKHFGRSWDELRSDWMRRMDEDRAPAGQAERLVLGHRIYGAVRNWEMWMLDQRPGPTASQKAAIRELFTQANRALAAGDLEAAYRALDQAGAAVELLRRPRLTT